MADAATAQTIRPPDRLRARVGAHFGGIDADAVARAEAALQEMSSQFDGWLEDEVAKLEAARIRVAAADPVAWRELHLRAHDLKGLGGTYGFPLVTRVCAGLCRLLDDEAARMRTPLPLVDAHVDAVRALVRDGVRDPTHPAGLQLCQALEARTAADLRSRD